MQMKFRQTRGPIAQAVGQAGFDLAYLQLLKSADLEDQTLRDQLETWRDRETDAVILRRIIELLNGLG